MKLNYCLVTTDLFTFYDDVYSKFSKYFVSQESLFIKQFGNKTLSMNFELFKFSILVSIT